MAIKESQLYNSIWQGCDELRGGMDASQYKDYVLVLLFVRYVSDKYSGQKSTEVVVPNGCSFVDPIALIKGKTNIGEGINKVLSTLAEANGLRGVLDSVDFNDEDKLGRGKDMQDRLSKLVAMFENPAMVWACFLYPAICRELSLTLMSRNSKLVPLLGIDETIEFSYLSGNFD